MKEIDIRDLSINPYTLFSKNWAALCSGDRENGFNAMTIAWGEMGALWERESHSNRLPVVTVYVRPSRYTNALMKKGDMFSVCFMPETQRKALGYLGSKHGGDDKNKIRNAGLTSIEDYGTVYMEEAELVLICRKLYQQNLTKDGMLDRHLWDFNYPQKDTHTMFIGEILKVMKK